MATPEPSPVPVGHPEDHGRPRLLAALGLPRRGWMVLRRVAVSVYSDGFIHAGNLAYLALVSLFPFFIVTAALAHGLGRGADTELAVEGFLRELPQSVRDLLRTPIADVLAQRTGSLLWLGGLVGLWTTGSFIETIRDILRRAYGTQFTKAFWRYRVGSTVLVVGAVIALLGAFTMQLLLTGVEEFVTRLLPGSDRVMGWIGWSRLAPLVTLFGALYVIFYVLAPSAYRTARSPKWPGAAFTASWWMLATMALPVVLAKLGGYDRTYGSLAGVIVALLFFWLVGFGLVIGAHLNAALAQSPVGAIRGPHQPAEE